MVCAPASARRLPERALLGGAAAILLAASGLQLHWARLESAARRLGGQAQAGARGLAQANRDFEQVRAHSPGTDALIAEGELALFKGQRRDAFSPLLAAVGSEPENALGWQLLAQAADGIDDRLAARANAELDRLKPPPAPRRAR